MSRETRKNKWLELMEKRTNKVLHQLRFIENLSDKRNYSFNEEDLKDVLKKEILSLQNLSENKIDEIIKNTNIKIDIIHPKSNKSISCEGNIAQVVLD